VDLSEALFLLVRAPGTWSFFGASTGWVKPSWSWEPTYDRLKAIGGPVGNATRLGGGHWSREYEHATGSFSALRLAATTTQPALSR
jgi:hypothetical protein